MPTVTDISILIIDDEADICNFFRRLLTRSGYQVATATNKVEAQAQLEQMSFNVAMVDMQLPDTSGIELLRAIKEIQPHCEVIIMTGYSTIKTAVAAMQYGAYDYLEKPFDDIDALEQLIAKATNHSAGSGNGSGSTNSKEWGPIAARIGMFIGQSTEMRRLIGLTYKLAAKDINILIQGETGTGKEVLARFIHTASTRAEHPFIAVNCGALPETLLESELFGHERGAFTGANQTRRGIFELADKGTLFLDEIADASPAIQVRLLRILETGKFCRTGGEKTISSDVRILSASNIDLEDAVMDGVFREDLYYRLNVVQLDIPPLSERREDILALSEHLLQGFAAQLKLDSTTATILQNHNWPGNIRELSNILRQAAALCDGDSIHPEHLAGRLSSTAVVSSRKNSKQTENDQFSLDEFWHYYANEKNLQLLTSGELNQLLLSIYGLEKNLLEMMRSKGLKPPQGLSLEKSEATTINKALEVNRWNITATAKRLGIARNTLHRKIKKYGLDRG